VRTEPSAASSGDELNSAAKGATPEGGRRAAGDSSESAPVDIAELYRQQRSGLRRRLVRLGRRNDADDLTHDAFVRTLAHKDRLESSGDGGGAYLNTVTRNLVQDRWKREGRAAHGAVRLAAGEDGTAQAADALAVSRLEGELVRAALGRLDEEKRHVLQLRVVEGRSSEETARLIGRTPAAVRQIQHRALVTLRADLTAQGWARPTMAQREKS
jgi:RNA polymerase sigma-70 factor, ECF subfamily